MRKDILGFDLSQCCHTPPRSVQVHFKKPQKTTTKPLPQNPQNITEI